MYAEMQSKAHEIISAVVTNIEPVKGIVTLELGKGGVATLPRNEQVAGEELREGQHVKVYVVDVMETERGPRMMISRPHPGLVKRMFEMEVPEIFDGTVEIKAISREAGARTKMAVWSKDENVDPVGACIGPRGQRVANIAGARTLPSSSARRSAPPPSWAWSCWRAIPNPAASPCRITSFRWPSATRARTRACARA